MPALIKYPCTNTSFMSKFLTIYVALLLMAGQLNAQPEEAARNWKTWFIKSGRDHRLSPPSAYRDEIAEVISIQQKLDSAGMQQVLYWNAGAPGYRWQDMI